MILTQEVKVRLSRTYSTCSSFDFRIKFGNRIFGSIIFRRIIVETRKIWNAPYLEGIIFEIKNGIVSIMLG